MFEDKQIDGKRFVRIHWIIVLGILLLLFGQHTLVY